jgi:hypothetical protein
MVSIPFTEYEVSQLIAARKFVARVMQDNTRGDPDPQVERRIIYDVRRRDYPAKDIRLRLFARLSPSLPGIGIKSTPGVALQWRGKNIRKLDRALRHDNIQYGVVIGIVRGWHEHIWTDEDQGRYIEAADPPVKQTDMKSVIRWCAEKWNIELEEIEQLVLGG